MSTGRYGRVRGVTAAAFLVAGLVALGAGRPVGAAKQPMCTTTSKGGTWSDPAAWSADQVPLSTDEACISGLNATVELTGFEGTAHTLQLGLVKTDTANLDITDSGACGSTGLTVDGGISVGPHGRTRIQLFSQCPDDTLIDVGSASLVLNHNGRLLNEGRDDYGTTQVIHGNVVNNGRFGSDELSEGRTQITGNYTQGAGGLLLAGSNSLTPTSPIVVGGSASLNGTILVGIPQPDQLGQTWTVLPAASITGTFASEQTWGNFGARYPRLSYTPTEVDATLVVAGIAADPNTAPPGAQITITGTTFPPGDHVVLSFKDHGKFSLGTATTDASGAFTDQVTIPADAPAGTVTIRADSTFLHTLEATTKLTIS